jgi:hypothetical protein
MYVVFLSTNVMRNIFSSDKYFALCGRLISRCSQNLRMRVKLKLLDARQLGILATECTAAFIINLGTRKRSASHPACFKPGKRTGCQLNGRLSDPRVCPKASEDLNYERMCSFARKLSIVVVVIVVVVVVVVVRCKPTLEWRKLITTVRLSSVKFHENLFTVVELLHANRWTIYPESEAYLYIFPVLRQIHSLFRKKFSRMCDPVLPLQVPVYVLLLKN